MQQAHEAVCAAAAVAHEAAAFPGVADVAVRAAEVDSAVIAEDAAVAVVGSAQGAHLAVDAVGLAGVVVVVSVDVDGVSR